MRNCVAVLVLLAAAAGCGGESDTPAYPQKTVRPKT
jgi:hypothetical protein